jgi:hypothetical protein
MKRPYPHLQKRGKRQKPIIKAVRKADVERTVIVEDLHYIVESIGPEDIVVRNPYRGISARLIGEEAGRWIASIKNAIDNSERAALCQGFLDGEELAPEW